MMAANVDIYIRLQRYIYWMPRPRFFTAEDFLTNAFTESDGVKARQIGAYFAALERTGHIRRIGETQARRKTSRGRRIGVYESIKGRVAK